MELQNYDVVIGKKESDDLILPSWEDSVSVFASTGGIQLKLSCRILRDVSPTSNTFDHSG